jgi:hypothetical protein
LLVLCDCLCCVVCLVSVDKAKSGLLSCTLCLTFRTLFLASFCVCVTCEWSSVNKPQQQSAHKRFLCAFFVFCELLFVSADFASPLRNAHVSLMQSIERRPSRPPLNALMFCADVEDAWVHVIARHLAALDIVRLSLVCKQAHHIAHAITTHSQPTTRRHLAGPLLGPPTNRHLAHITTFRKCVAAHAHWPHLGVVLNVHFDNWAGYVNSKELKASWELVDLVWDAEDHALAMDCGCDLPDDYFDDDRAVAKHAFAYDVSRQFDYWFGAGVDSRCTLVPACVQVLNMGAQTFVQMMGTCELRERMRAWLELQSAVLVELSVCGDSCVCALPIMSLFYLFYYETHVASVVSSQTKTTCAKLMFVCCLLS